VLTCGPEEMRDLEAAHRWYQRSAASGCPEGCLGYALPLAPRTQDEAERHEVAEHLRRAAEAELPTAIYLPAVLTEQGVGVARDPVVAAQLYGHGRARSALGAIALGAGADGPSPVLRTAGAVEHEIGKVDLRDRVAGFARDPQPARRLVGVRRHPGAGQIE